MNWLGMFIAVLVVSLILSFFFLVAGLAFYSGNGDRFFLKLFAFTITITVVSAMVVGALS